MVIIAIMQMYRMNGGPETRRYVGEARVDQRDRGGGRTKPLVRQS